MPWKITSWAQVNKKAAGVIAALLVIAVVSCVSASLYAVRAWKAEKQERAQAAKIGEMEKEAEAERAAFQKALGATEPALKGALAGVREARTALVQAQAARQDPWIPPTVDNLASRFDRAVEGLR